MVMIRRHSMHCKTALQALHVADLLHCYFTHDDDQDELVLTAAFREALIPMEKMQQKTTLCSPSVVRAKLLHQLQLTM